MARHPIPAPKKYLVSDPFHFLRQEFDRLFDSGPTMQGLQPVFEVKENTSGIKITTELPGVSENDIDVSLVDDVLTISGEKNQKSTMQMRPIILWREVMVLSLVL